MKTAPAIKLSSRTAFEGRVFAVSVERVRLPHGHEANMEVVRHPTSVILLPMPDPTHLVLVRQYRFPIDRWIWELPAGSLEPGEDPAAAAQRECHEEIGQVPTQIERLGSFYPTPGYCDEEMIYFRLGGLTAPSTKARHDEDEDLEPRLFSVEEARQLLRSEEAVDMKTALGLTLIQER